jgi:hypothetical protein
MAKNQTGQKFFATIIDDIMQLFRDIFSGAFLNTIAKDLRELHDFFIDRDRKKRLKSMGWFRKWFLMFFWLIKALILKLSSFRRILFLIAIFFIISSPQNRSSNNSIFFGVLIFMFILLLELKDKLLARQELEAGRAVQKALLPDQSPSVAGWDIWLYSKPANDVGGDLVDFIEIDQDRFGLVLGDVAGKGLGAALFMAKLQSTLRALVFNFESLAKLAESMNNIFYRDTIPNSFSSMFYIEISANSGKTRYVNAGHIPPVIIRKQKNTILPKGAQALGIMPDVAYSEQTMKLNTGEFLLIYSDGLSEARNSNDVFFGDEKIIKITEGWDTLNTGQAGQSLLDEVHKFARNTSQTDDLSLVILKRLAD